MCVHVCACVYTLFLLPPSPDKQSKACLSENGLSGSIPGMSLLECPYQFSWNSFEPGRMSRFHCLRKDGGRTEGYFLLLRHLKGSYDSCNMCGDSHGAFSTVSKKIYVGCSGKEGVCKQWGRVVELEWQTLPYCLYRVFFSSPVYLYICVFLATYGLGIAWDDPQKNSRLACSVEFCVPLGCVCVCVCYEHRFFANVL